MPFSSDAELLLRRSKVASLYLLGWLQARIAVEVGVSQSQISLDIAAIQDEWRETMLADFAEAKAKELAKIDNLESMYWAGWERSMRSIKKTSKKMKGRIDPDRGQAQKASSFDQTDQTIERDGNSRFLDGVYRCIELRTRILGLEAPIKVKMDNSKFPDWLNAARPSSN